MSQPGQLSHGLPPRDPISELARRNADLAKVVQQTQAALAQAIQANTVLIAALTASQPVIVTGATVAVAALAAGALAGSSVSFPATLPSAPRLVIADVTGFISGSSGTIVKATTSYTTTGFSATMLNTASAGTATFSGLPITYIYWL